MIAITLGDPFSINAELLATVLAAHSPWLASAASGHEPTPVVLIGSAFHWRDQLARLGVPSRLLSPTLLRARVDPWPTAPGLYLLDVGPGPWDAAPAELLPEPVRGALAVAALEVLRTLPDGRGLAVVTAPIAKPACVAAGWPYPGQTEFVAELWQGEAVMMLAGPRLRVALATNHLALRDVPGAITTAGLTRKILLTAATLRELFGIEAPRIAVLGLNPHAGDKGLFGDDEARVIAPAISAAAARLADENVQLIGPVPADTAFYRGYHGAYDAVLAMYHDQGLGPLKTVHFDEAVNVSGGLRHLRVSPDHGPAQDLFLRGQASSKSMATALSLGLAYVARQRR